MPARMVLLYLEMTTRRSLRTSTTTDDGAGREANEKQGASNRMDFHIRDLLLLSSLF